MGKYRCTLMDAFGNYVLKHLFKGLIPRMTWNILMASYGNDFTKTNEVLVIIIVAHTNVLDFRVKISLKCHDCDLWIKVIQIGLLKSTLPTLSLILHWLRFHDHKCIKLLKNVTCHELRGASKAAIWYAMW